jgi:arsenate reductase
MSKIIVYHNPQCSNSRGALTLIRQSGAEPEVIEYLKHPPTREKLVELIAAMGIRARDLLRSKEAVYAELNLDDPAITDDQLIDAMIAHPVLMNRPIVVTSMGTRLCRPPQIVLEILPEAPQG